MEQRKKKKAYKKGLVFVTFKQGVGPEEARALIKNFQLKIKEDRGVADKKVLLVVEVASGREQKWVDKFPRLKKNPIVESAERIPVLDIH
ncbi:MAG: hypothetical protein HY813_02055 [Candidatus Portnoybacteria bacterium]|nr:hypothetical protein [Candidatus Portnoybacteria bacterium]